MLIFNERTSCILNWRLPMPIWCKYVHSIWSTKSYILWSKRALALGSTSKQNIIVGILGFSTRLNLYFYKYRFEDRNWAICKCSRVLLIADKSQQSNKVYWNQWTKLYRNDKKAKTSTKIIASNNTVDIQVIPVAMDLSSADVIIPWCSDLEAGYKNG